MQKAALVVRLTFSAEFRFHMLFASPDGPLSLPAFVSRREAACGFERRGRLSLQIVCHASRRPGKNATPCGLNNPAMQPRLQSSNPQIPAIGCDRND
ncbi:hypothetical protein [Paraburkholderia nemoris]|uniref:hypothetical protein n=1 Tax=Paraburkholderia nemoris TaxID=2793076 RepID=UPI001B8D0A65|nr:hypothetical protein [Paraburkholderia nemoris]